MAYDKTKPVIAFLSEKADLSALAERYKLAYSELDVRLPNDLGDLAEITAAVCWYPPQGALSRLPNLQMIQSVGAGIEHITKDQDLPKGIPIFRILDDEMGLGMAAYVTWAIVDHHRRFKDFSGLQKNRVWNELQTSAPSQYVVGVAGFGALGEVCAQVLISLGYAVRGWSRNPKEKAVPGVAHYFGPSKLVPFLTGCNALICLLPLTAKTKGFLNKENFEHLADGAHLINVGRGEHLVEDDLILAMKNGKIGRATLDTFITEPLPMDHYLWRQQDTIITPHIATSTTFETIIRQTLENFDAVSNGNTRSARRVDPESGY